MILPNQPWKHAVISQLTWAIGPFHPPALNKLIRKDVFLSFLALIIAHLVTNMLIHKRKILWNKAFRSFNLCHEDRNSVLTLLCCFCLCRCFICGSANAATRRSSEMFWAAPTTLRYPPTWSVNSDTKLCESSKSIQNAMFIIWKVGGDFAHIQLTDERSGRWCCCFKCDTPHCPASEWLMQCITEHISPENEFLNKRVLRFSQQQLAQQNRFCWCGLLTDRAAPWKALSWPHRGRDANNQNKQQPSALVFAAYCIFLERGRCIREPPTNPTVHTTSIFLDCVSLYSYLKKRTMLLMFWFSSLSLYESQSHIPELETPLSERVRAFLDWLQDNRAFSSMIHVVK